MIIDGSWKLEPDHLVPFFSEPQCISDDTARIILRLLIRINEPPLINVRAEHWRCYVLWLVDCVAKNILAVDALVALIEMYARQSFARPHYLAIRSLTRERILQIPYIQRTIARNPHLHKWWPKAA